MEPGKPKSPQNYLLFAALSPNMLRMSQPSTTLVWVTFRYYCKGSEQRCLPCNIQQKQYDQVACLKGRHNIFSLNQFNPFYVTTNLSKFIADLPFSTTHNFYFSIGPRDPITFSEWFHGTQILCVSEVVGHPLLII